MPRQARLASRHWTTLSFPVSKIVTQQRSRTLAISTALTPQTNTLPTQAQIRVPNPLQQRQTSQTTQKLQPQKSKILEDTLSARSPDTLRNKTLCNLSDPIIRLVSDPPKISHSWHGEVNPPGRTTRPYPNGRRSCTASNPLGLSTGWPPPSNLATVAISRVASLDCVRPRSMILDIPGVPKTEPDGKLSTAGMKTQANGGATAQLPRSHPSCALIRREDTKDSQPTTIVLLKSQTQDQLGRKNSPDSNPKQARSSRKEQTFAELARDRPNWDGRKRTLARSARRFRSEISDAGSLVQIVWSALGTRLGSVRLPISFPA